VPSGSQFISFLVQFPNNLISQYPNNIISFLFKFKDTTMRTVIQRVSSASVTIEGKEHAAIGQGLLVLLGIEDADTEEDIVWLSGKIVNLRIFDDADGVMNESVKDKNGDILLVSQFTLHASTKKGNRPSYIKASKPDIAVPLYEKMIQQLETELSKKIQCGVFGADMKVALVNDGPVTIVVDTKNKE
jgi:D-aminoacyl-tRNA deacylase